MEPTVVPSQVLHNGHWAACSKVLRVRAIPLIHLEYKGGDETYARNYLTLCFADRAEFERHIAEMQEAFAISEARVVDQKRVQAAQNADDKLTEVIDRGRG